MLLKTNCHGCNNLISYKGQLCLFPNVRPAVQCRLEMENYVDEHDNCAVNGFCREHTNLKEDNFNVTGVICGDKLSLTQLDNICKKIEPYIDNISYYNYLGNDFVEKFGKDELTIQHSSTINILRKYSKRAYYTTVFYDYDDTAWSFAVDSALQLKDDSTWILLVRDANKEISGIFEVIRYVKNNRLAFGAIYDNVWILNKKALAQLGSNQKMDLLSKLETVENKDQVCPNLAHQSA